MYGLVVNGQEVGELKWGNEVVKEGYFNGELFWKSDTYPEPISGKDLGTGYHSYRHATPYSYDHNRYVRIISNTLIGVSERYDTLYGTTPRLGNTYKGTRFTFATSNPNATLGLGLNGPTVVWDDQSKTYITVMYHSDGDVNVLKSPNGNKWSFDNLNKYDKNKFASTISPIVASVYPGPKDESRKAKTDKINWVMVYSEDTKSTLIHRTVDRWFINTPAVDLVYYENIGKIKDALISELLSSFLFITEDKLYMKYGVLGGSTTSNSSLSSPSVVPLPSLGGFKLESICEAYEDSNIILILRNKTTNKIKILKNTVETTDSPFFGPRTYLSQTWESSIEMNLSSIDTLGANEDVPWWNWSCVWIDTKRYYLLRSPLGGLYSSENGIDWADLTDKPYNPDTPTHTLYWNRKNSKVYLSSYPSNKVWEFSI